MNGLLKTAAILVLAVPAISTVQASEAEFLEAFEGNWNGAGQIRLKPESEPVDVSCSLDSQASGDALSMDGACRAMAVFSRQIGADLQAEGTRYSGSYVGSNRGTARLDGQRSGDTINLQVAWPDKGSGERVASMAVASLGEGRMRLTTVEKHPQTGEEVVTAQIDFNRE